MKFNVDSLSYNDSKQLTDELVKVLGRDDVRSFSQYRLIKDWRAFCTEPSKYIGTVVVDMVNQYINEHFDRISKYSGPEYYGAQSVLLNDLQ